MLGARASTGMTTFGLLHGGGHGAWCWARVEESLAELGHRGVSMDLPIEDDNAGAREYAAVALAALSGIPEPIVVVGHSLGGLVVPLVARVRPTLRMVFLAAMLPQPGMSVEQQRLEDPEMLLPYVGENNGINKERFYNTCSADDAEWAYRQLRRQSRRISEETTPLGVWPEVSASYIVCTEDHAISPVWGRRVAIERLGVTARELNGSDHSPMLNRPGELARLLAKIVNDPDHETARS